MEKLIDASDGYEYQGMWLDSTLNMNEHLQRILGKVNSRIQLLPHLRHSLSVLPPVVYTSFILLTMLYCSMPVIKALGTMAREFNNVQKRAQEVIYGLQ